jgi:hypothetical protein
MSRTKGRIRPLVALFAALVACLAVAAPAGASTVKLAGGYTTLKLYPATAAALKSLGVNVSLVRPATVSHGGVSFPITGGRIDPATAAGVIAHQGGLVLSAGGTRVRLTSFNVRVGAHSSLSALIGRTRVRVRIFNLDTSRARITRSGLGTHVTGVRATLTGLAARALNGAFHVHAFTAGLPFGTVSVHAVPAQFIIQKGSTTLALDPGTAQALTMLGVSVAPIAPASAGSSGIAFPITGGLVDAKTLVGQIRHSGGLELKAGSTTVDLSNFYINVNATPDLTAQLGSARVSILSLDLSGLTEHVSGRTITLGGVVAKLTAGAAAALNHAFGTTALKAGLVVGRATVVATVR